MEFKKNKTLQADRKYWIALLNSADPEDLKAARKKLSATIKYAYISRPETGMIMAQAKADGIGKHFCLGEVTVTKCILEVMERTLGYAMILGPDTEHAKLAALFDGLLQLPEYNKELMATLIPSLEKKQTEKDDLQARQRSDTTVEFFTLRRGE